MNIIQEGILERRKSTAEVPREDISRHVDGTKEFKLQSKRGMKHGKCGSRIKMMETEKDGEKKL
jgi:hypothetical protein